MALNIKSSLCSLKLFVSLFVHDPSIFDGDACDERMLQFDQRNVLW